MKIDHVHFYVEDAKVWRDWFVNYLGFTPMTSGIHSFHTCTEAVKSGVVKFLLSSPLLPTSPVAEFLRQHPPGVADIAFAVDNVEVAIAHAQANGATVLQSVEERQCGNLVYKCSKIAAWGSLTHTLIEHPPEAEISPSNSIFTAIDHVVLNVAAGDLQSVVSWYEKIFDFQPRQTFKIQTDHSALYSQVMVSRQGSIQLPVNEPASKNSQIQEFLNYNRGAGIQHIALQTNNLVNAIAEFRQRGLSLLSVPQTYYSQLQQRPGLPLSPGELAAIAQQEILVDWQPNSDTGVLLQIFTQPIFGQPTFFFEFIERRHQAQGFGEGNFRALFEAIESEQIKRGTLQ